MACNCKDGIKGMVKAITGTDATPRDVRLQRANTCQSCGWRAGPLCTDCGCLIQLKIRVASEECPAGKWGKVDQHGEA